MSFWLTFFEQITQQMIDRATTRVEGLKKVSFSNQTPADEIQQEFEFFMNIKQHAQLFRNCLKFMLIADKKERSNTFEATNTNEQNYFDCCVKLPKTAEELVILCGAYPIGIMYIHKYLYRILENDSFKLLCITDSIDEKLYFNLVNVKMAAVWLQDEGLTEIIELIQQLYGQCQYIYNYHKKNNWCDFNQDFDTNIVDISIIDQDTDHLDP